MQNIFITRSPKRSISISYKVSIQPLLHTYCVVCLHVRFDLSLTFATTTCLTRKRALSCHVHCKNIINKDHLDSRASQFSGILNLLWVRLIINIHVDSFATEIKNILVGQDHEATSQLSHTFHPDLISMLYIRKSDWLLSTKNASRYNHSIDTFCLSLNFELPQKFLWSRVFYLLNYLPWTSNDLKHYLVFSIQFATVETSFRRYCAIYCRIL